MKKIALLFCVTVCVYAFSFGNIFLWDDEQFIVKNTYVQDLSYWPMYFSTSTTEGAGIVSNYYRPLTTLSFAFDRAIWGNRPFGFHLTNTFFHALGAVLVFLFLRTMLAIGLAGKKSSEHASLLAYFSAFAFALHPAQVEAVAYINSRGDSLSLVYGLASILLLMQITNAQSENKRIVWGFSAFIAFCISVLTKETGIVWVGVSVLYCTALATQKIKIRPGVWVVVGLQTAASLLYLMLRFTVLQFQSASDVWGSSSAYLQSPILRLGIFFTQAVPEYLSILFWPSDLRMERDAGIVLNGEAPTLPILALLLALAGNGVGYALYLLKKGKRLPHPYLLGLLLVTLFMAPFSGILPLNGILYEHWLYAPMIGWWLLCFSLLKKWLPHFAFIILVSGVLAIWGVQSIRQIFVWRSPFTLFPHILKYTDSARVRVNLGMAYAESQRYDQAIAEYTASIALTDRYPQTFHNLGNAYRETGEYTKAVESYTKALEIDPYFYFSLYQLIELEIKRKDKEAAERWSKYATEHFPDDPSFAALQAGVQSTQW